MCEEVAKGASAGTAISEKQSKMCTFDGGKTWDIESILRGGNSKILFMFTPIFLREMRTLPM